MAGAVRRRRQRADGPSGARRRDAARGQARLRLRWRGDQRRRARPRPRRQALRPGLGGRGRTRHDGDPASAGLHARRAVHRLLPRQRDVHAVGVHARGDTDDPRRRVEPSSRPAGDGRARRWLSAVLHRAHRPCLAGAAGDASSPRRAAQRGASLDLRRHQRLRRAHGREAGRRPRRRPRADGYRLSVRHGHGRSRRIPGRPPTCATTSAIS